MLKVCIYGLSHHIWYVVCVRGTLVPHPSPLSTDAYTDILAAIIGAAGLLTSLLTYSAHGLKLSKLLILITGLILERSIRLLLFTWSVHIYTA